MEGVRLIARDFEELVQRRQSIGANPLCRHLVPQGVAVSTQVAFLRAVNVGGRAIVKMDDLQRAFERAGARNVQTVIQSGNVLFDAAEGAAAEFRKRIEADLKRLLGGPPTIAWRTASHLQRLVDALPFDGVPIGADDKLYVGFLVKKPAKAIPLPVLRPKDGLEMFKMSGQEAFVICRKVQGKYGFPNLLIEEVFGVPATTRNWNTVERMAKLGGMKAGRAAGAKSEPRIRKS
jgi:uncharacterized protein (DUF1697 family)